MMHDWNDIEGVKATGFNAIKVLSENLYVAIDKASGGYPYLTRYFPNAAMFQDKEEATELVNKWSAYDKNDTYGLRTNEWKVVRVCVANV